MAQYKKDSIKESIHEAALAVFAQKGYKGTKISDISQFGGISVGNIYRYYKSKEEIFYHIVPEDFLKQLQALLYKKIKTAGEEGFWLVNEEVLAFLVQNRLTILIVLGGSEGTRYEDARQELIAFLTTAVKAAEGGTRSTERILRCIYRGLINSTLEILAAAQGMEELQEALAQLHSYHLFGMRGLLKGE